MTEAEEVAQQAQKLLDDGWTDPVMAVIDAGAELGYRDLETLGQAAALLGVTE